MPIYKVEIFTGNCSLCNETIALIQSTADPACKISICNLQEDREKAQRYGVTAVPAIAINGVLISVGKPSQSHLRAIGIPQPNPSHMYCDFGWGI
jgi:hypothetical protein